MSIFYTNKTITMNRGDSGVVLLSILNRDDTPFALPIGMKNPTIVFSVKAETDTNDLNGNMLIEEYMPIKDYTYYGYGTPDESGQMKIRGGFYPKSKTVNTEESVIDTGIIYKVLANKKYMFVVPTTTPPVYPVSLTKREYAFAVPLVFEPAFTDRLSPGTYTYSITLLDSTSPITRVIGDGEQATEIVDFDGYLKNVILKQDLFGSQKLILGDSPIARVHGDPIRRMYYIKPCSEESVANASASEITTGNITNIALPPVYIATKDQLGGVIVGETLQVDLRGVLDVSTAITNKIADLYNKIGDMTTLTTDEKTTLVGAINEVDSHADANKREIGDRSELTTDEKTTLVRAINEVDSHADTGISKADAAQVTADNATTLANTGISKADRAQSAADNAQQDAETAQATADNATTLANTGISKAEQAQSTANTAVDKANDAKATAQEAIMKADGRSTSIGFMTAKDAVTALNGYPRTQLKGGDTIWIVEDGTPDLWVTDVAQESVPYNYTTKDKFNQDLVDNKVLQIGYFKTAYQESDGKPVTIAWQNVLVKSTDWVASTEFADFPYEAKIELTDFVDYTTVPQVVFDIADTMSGNYAPICKSGDKCVYIYGKVQDEITLKTVITFAPNVNGASLTGGGYNNRGKWVASTTYEINDLVYTDNRQFVCIEGITSTTSPEQDTQHWQATFVANVPVTSVNGQTGAVTIDVPTKTSDLTNDSNFAATSDIPTKTSQLTNDSGFITANDIPDAPDVPTALPQEAVAVKSGELPTTGWTIAAMPLWEGDHYSAPDEGSYQLLPAGSINFDLVSKVDNTKWFVSIDGDYSATQDVLSIGTAIYVRKSNSSSIYYTIKSDGSLYCNTSGSTRVHFYGIKNAEYGKFVYGISDSSITVNSDVLMELTDSEVKSYSIEAGKITVIRDNVPTSPIPYTYKVKQTNASGQFTVLNHYMPESPTDLPVTYKKASGELPTTGWNQLGWEQSTLPESGYWSEIAYGKGKFVTIAREGGKGAYSTNGINWTKMTMPSTGLWQGMAYGNGKFVAVKTSSDKGAYSVDGINWTETTMPSSPAYKNWSGVAYGNGKFVAFTMDSSYCAYSNDGITWTETTLPTKRNWRSMAYGNDKFVAVARGTDKGAYSTDGISWTEMTLPASRNWQGITYGDGKFIAIAGDTDKGAYSTDGITWTEMTLPASRDWFCTAYGNGKFVAIEYNGLRAAYSTDGITWLAMNTPIIRSWCGVVYGDNKFVVVSRDASVSSQNNKALYWEVDSKFTYTISDTFITTNTSVKMYLTDEGGVKALRRENGSVTVLRGMVPTTVIPYEYEVKQTSTSGLFEVINAYVPDVPTKTSELTNDSGFLTTADIPTKTSQLTNDSGFITNSAIGKGTLTIQKNGANVATFGANQSENATVNISVPTKTSDLTNDSGFITTADIGNALYPVGSIYMSVNDTNPSTFFGGTWVSWGAGKVPVGVDTNDTNFATVEKTGGEKQHTLTIAEMPEHNHTIPCTPTANDGSEPSYQAAQVNAEATGYHNSIVAVSSGGGSPHNNLQPYITCYMWKRTA